MKDLQLDVLNEYESVDLLIASTKRPLTLDELYCDGTSMTLHEALQHEPNLKNCQGIPQYIKILANLLELNTFDTINIKREIPTWLRREIKRQTLLTQQNTGKAYSGFPSIFSKLF